MTAVDVLRRTKEGLLTGYCKDHYEQNLADAIEDGVAVTDVIPGDHPCGTVRCLLGWLRVSAGHRADADLYSRNPERSSPAYVEALNALDRLAPPADHPCWIAFECSPAEAYAESDSTTVEDLCHLIDRTIDSLVAPPTDLSRTRDFEVAGACQRVSETRAVSRVW